MRESLEKLYPVWLAWRWDIDVPKAGRSGIPKGEPVPIAGTKFLAAASMILFPRGKDLRGIAEIWETSASLIGKWRTEDRFKILVEQLEESFARYVVNKMKSQDFAELLHSSPCEPECWSERVLEIFVYNLAKAITKQSRGKDPFFLARKDFPIGKDAWWFNLPLPEASKPIPRFDLTPPPIDSEAMLIWQDILSVALQGLHNYPWQKRGPKPKKKRDIVREKLEMIQRILRAIEAGEVSGEWASNYAKVAIGELEDLGQMLNIRKTGE